jgi:hypothetical protein
MTRLEHNLKLVRDISKRIGCNSIGAASVPQQQQAVEEGAAAVQGQLEQPSHARVKDAGACLKCYKKQR